MEWRRVELELCPVEWSRVECLLLQLSIRFSRPVAFGNQPFNLLPKYCHNLRLTMKRNSRNRMKVR